MTAAGFVVKDGKPVFVSDEDGDGGYQEDPIVTESGYVESINQLIPPLNAGLMDLAEKWADLENRLSALENAQ